LTQLKSLSSSDLDQATDLVSRLWILLSSVFRRLTLVNWRRILGSCRRFDPPDFSKCQTIRNVQRLRWNVLIDSKFSLTSGTSWPYSRSVEATFPCLAYFGFLEPFVLSIRSPSSLSPVVVSPCRLADGSDIDVSSPCDYIQQVNCGATSPLRRSLTSAASGWEPQGQRSDQGVKVHWVLRGRRAKHSPDALHEGDGTENQEQ